jgi:hypothetical protein
VTTGAIRFKGGRGRVRTGLCEGVVRWLRMGLMRIGILGLILCQNWGSVRAGLCENWYVRVLNCGAFDCVVVGKS